MASSGWYNGGSRCFNNISIRIMVGRMDVDEHDYQPPWMA